MLELQWAIAERGIYYPLDTAQFWRNLQPIELHGRRFLTLSPQNLVLFLCIHGGKHMWGRLTWISDLAHFIKSYPDFDWTRFMERAIKDGFYRIVCVGLQLADALGGAQLPHPIKSRYHSDQITKELAAKALENIINKTASSDASNVDYYLRSRERIRDRLYYFVDQAFVPKQADWLTISLPKSLYPVYYILRPIRLLIKFGPHLMQTLVRN